MSDQRQDNLQNEKPSVPKQRRPLTEEERAKLRHKREMELKRRQQVLKNGTPEEKEELFAKTMATHSAYQQKVEIKPVTFRQKWSNYWYHYKTHTIAAVLGVLLVAFFVRDMVTKEKYDISIMAITNNANYVVDYSDEMLASWSDYIEDVNGDGKCNVSIESVVMDQDETEVYDTDEGGETKTTNVEDPNQVMAYTVRYQASLGEVMHNVYLVDEENYDTLLENEVEFVDLSQYSDSANVDGDKYYVKDNPLFADFSNKDQLILVVRDVAHSSKSDKEKYVQQFEDDLEVVKKIMAEEP
ncbi:MAG: hypothetical protein ACOX60_04280 [Massiliimalia sp.]|jgi:hypothetical protein